MKIIISFFCLVFSILFACCSNSTEPGNNASLAEIGEIKGAKKIVFIDESVGWALLADKKLSVTKDGGKSWVALSVPQTEILTDVQFINQNAGWLSSYNTIYKTEDAGITWKAILTDTTNNAFICMKMIDGNNGWASGTKDAQIYRTTNGGQNWSLVNLNAIGKIAEIQFTDNNNGWCVEALGRIYKTTDGGNSWLQVQSIMYATCIYPINGTFCFAGNNMLASSLANQRATVYKTLDGGKKWIDLGIPHAELIGKIIFADNKNGCVITDFGNSVSNGNSLVSGYRNLYYTPDGGYNWKTLDIGSNSVKDITLAGTNILVLTWDDKLLKITN